MKSPWVYRVGAAHHRSLECIAVVPDSGDTHPLAVWSGSRRAIPRRRSRQSLQYSAHRSPPPHPSHSLASTLPVGRHPCRPGHITRENVGSRSAWHTSIACVAVLVLSLRGCWALRPCPRTYLQPPARPKQGPFPPACSPRPHRYYDPLGLPPDTTRFRALRLYQSPHPTWIAGTALSCSASTLRDVPPPLPREAPVHAPTLAHCAWPSLRHDQLGAPNHLSVDNLTRLARRSLLVAARRFAPCRHAQALDTPLAVERSHAPRGACFPALRRLPGRDSHPRSRCSLNSHARRIAPSCVIVRQDAPCMDY